MNKKEIAEIKKQFKPENLTGAGKIVGCYVEGCEKQRLMTFDKNIYSIPDEELFKYIDLLKASLSGGLGKTLHNLEFPLEESKPDGSETFLRYVVESGLNDEELLSEMYDKIIETCNMQERYIILVYRDTYDVPGKALDGAELEDSGDVYDYMLCMICPVTLSKPKLAVDYKKEDIVDGIRNWNIEKPTHAFLYPAFNDRATDLHSTLYFTKKVEEQGLVEEFLCCESIISSKEQKNFMENMVTEVFGKDCKYETVESIIDDLTTVKDIDENRKVGIHDIEKILSNAGADDEGIERFKAMYEAKIGEGKKLLPSNLLGSDKVDVSCTDMTIKVSSDRTGMIQTKVIDGRPCLVIQIDGTLTVDNIPVYTK